MLEDSRIRLIKNTINRGVNYSLNVILENAKGKYLAFQSADDFIFPEFFKKLLEIAQRYPEAGVCCSDCAICYDHTPEAIHVTRLLKDEIAARFFSPLQIIETFRSTDFWIRGHTAIVKRDSLLTLGGFHKCLEPHDDWFLLHAIALQEGVAYLPEALAVWRQVPDSYCRKFLANKRRTKEAHRQLLTLLSLQENRHLRILFRKATILRESIKLLFCELLFQPRYWDFLGVIVLKFLRKKIMKIYRT